MMMIGLCVAEKMAEEKKLEDKMMEEKKMEEMMMKEKKTDDLEPETLEQLVREARSNKNHKCCHQPKFCKNDKHCRNFHIAEIVEITGGATMDDAGAIVGVETSQR